MCRLITVHKRKITSYVISIMSVASRLVAYFLFYHMPQVLFVSIFGALLGVLAIFLHRKNLIGYVALTINLLNIFTIWFFQNADFGRKGTVL